MFEFLKNLTKEKNKSTPVPNLPDMTERSDKEGSSSVSLLTRFQEKLSRTRKLLSHTLADLFLGKKTIDASLMHELENILLRSDVGIQTSKWLLTELTATIERQHLKETKALYIQLQMLLKAILIPCEKPFVLPFEKKPFVILMIGVNGTGKTTTIGKLAHHFQNKGQKVLLAAGDTFRAAAIEQLITWGQRNQVPVIAQHTGADSASVIFDAFQAAKARDIDVMIADTAGRLHTQSTLLEELKKIKRILTKLDPSAPHEIMLVLDASTGQNALVQAQKFHEAVGITGLTLTKLDGTAKGGIIFAIASQLKLPIRFIGIGEGIDDLRPFQTTEFVDALFTQTTTTE